MREHLEELGVTLETSPEEMRRFANRTYHFPDGLTKIIKGVMAGNITPKNIKTGTYGWDDGQVVYDWLVTEYTHKEIKISSNFRRSIGNMAAKHNISSVQMTEFFRLLLIDVVNHELRQADDEIPLEKQG